MDSNHDKEPSRGISRGTWVLIGFIVVAGYFLFSEHRAHFIDYLPFLLLLACPLLHLFHGHGGHGGHAAHRDDAQGGPRAPGDSSGDQPPAGPQHHHEGDRR